MAEILAGPAVVWADHIGDDEDFEENDNSDEEESSDDDDDDDNIFDNNQPMGFDPLCVIQ